MITPTAAMRSARASEFWSSFIAPVFGAVGAPIPSAVPPKLTAVAAEIAPSVSIARTSAV